METAIGVFGAVALLALGIAQLALGFGGLEYLAGWWAGMAGLVAALGFRFMLPMTIGSYFGAVEVMGWPWWVGVLIAVPGLLFLIPGAIASVIAAFRGRA